MTCQLAFPSGLTQLIMRPVWWGWAVIGLGPRSLLWRVAYTQTVEILGIALVRAKIYERLGHQLRAKATEKYFTMGLLSVLEALYESPMQEILDKLPLPEDRQDALVHGTGELGLVLSYVKAYEAGEWMELKPLQLKPSIIRDFYLESIDWANHFSPMIS